MQARVAREIANLLSGASAGLQNYRLEKQIYKKLSGFHQWADGRACEGAFLFKDINGSGLWLVVVDWKGDGNFYVVLFPESRSGPIAEIHRFTDAEEGRLLHWRYSPRKRDSKNEERKLYFSEVFFSVDVKVSVPRGLVEVDDFIEELFSLAESRLKADCLDSDRPVLRNGFPEGKLKERLHLVRERNRDLVRRAKSLALSRYGCLKCACCGFDFLDKYGELGRGFIEAHHTRPLSSLNEEGEEMSVEDLALVCSNCHRMLHRKRPWLGMDELRNLLPSR